MISIIIHNTHSFSTSCTPTQTHKHPRGCRMGISTIAFNSHIHTVAFNGECIALGHKPEALGCDRESCVWESGGERQRILSKSKAAQYVYVGVKGATVCICAHTYVTVHLCAAWECARICVCTSLWCWRRCCHWRQSGHHSDPEWNKDVSPEYQSDFSWDIKRPIAAIHLTRSLSSGPVQD